jgi:phosphoglycerate dehydrogenase-like enzyme
MMKVILYGAPVVPFAHELPPRLKTDWEIINVDDLTSSKVKSMAFASTDAVIAVDYGHDIPLAPNVKMVHVPGAGCDGILNDALPHGAALCNVHKHEKGVAEFVIMAMLQWNVRYMEAVQSFRAGSWERSSRFGAEPHSELSGKTVGIVGLGRIGQTLARYVKTFGTKVVAANYSRFLDGDKPEFVDEVLPLSDVVKVAEQSDFLVICGALTEKTQGLINENVFKAMPLTAILINVARGPLVDEDALYNAVTTRSIAGAAIDVWYNYPDSVNADVPPSKHRFDLLPNVYMTPHLAGWTKETVRRRWDFIAENLDRLALGRELKGIVFRRIPS